MSWYANRNKLRIKKNTNHGSATETVTSANLFRRLAPRGFGHCGHCPEAPTLPMAPPGPMWGRGLPSQAVGRRRGLGGASSQEAPASALRYLGRAAGRRVGYDYKIWNGGRARARGRTALGP